MLAAYNTYQQFIIRFEIGGATFDVIAPPIMNQNYKVIFKHSKLFR